MTSIESLKKWSGKDICDERDFPNIKSKLNIPAFVNEEQKYKQARQWRQNVEVAKVGAAVGTAKKQARRYERAERSKKECILFLIGAALMLLLVGAIG